MELSAMIGRRLINGFLTATLAALCLSGSVAAQAETREQRIWLDVVDPGNGAQCEVRAIFKGDHDNCRNDDARGRADCSKDRGCVCTRQEKKVQWSMAKGSDKNKENFTIAFNQGSKNPFVKDGSNECNFKSNKEGNLRCRVKGKDVPRGIYRYSIEVSHCKPLVTQLKIY
jgi:hypothetical protein